MLMRSSAPNIAGSRDPRLDFFRGLGMFIILIAHIPGNGWADWLPRRFGFSDAADMFVFCSGMASALAFARIFDNFGWLVGTARIFYRVWQVYWVHVGSFLAVVTALVLIDMALGTMDYEQQLGLGEVLAAPRLHLVGVMTLTYLPNYFDILPMYLVILAMVPVVMALARLHRALVGVLVAALWGGTNFFDWHFTADMMSGRAWFFNPFGWQLVFMTGFAFVRGWLPVPPRRPLLTGLALLVVLAAVPVSFPQNYQELGGLGHLHDALKFWTNKTSMGLLRYVHFMATAYLAYVVSGVGGQNLTGPVVDVFRKVGQQTLAVFVVGLVAAQVLAVGFRFLGDGFFATALINLAGIGSLIVTAHVVGWFKVPPWRRPERQKPEISDSQRARYLSSPESVEA